MSLTHYQVAFHLLYHVLYFYHFIYYFCSTFICILYFDNNYILYFEALKLLLMMAVLLQLPPLRCQNLTSINV